MKTINLELSKRLAPYLKDMETELYICGNDEYGPYSQDDVDYLNRNNAPVVKYGIFKTLTLEEAIDFLPYRIDEGNYVYSLDITKNKDGYRIWYTAVPFTEELKEDEWGDVLEVYTQTYLTHRHIFGSTLLEAIEKMLEYLLDNNKLGKQ